VSLGIWWEHGYQKQYTRAIIGNLEECTKDINWSLAGTLVLKEKKVNVHHLALPSPKIHMEFVEYIKGIIGNLVECTNERHHLEFGGNIDIKSKQGKCSSFIFTLT
jgi:hypothetical protein